MKPDEEIDLEIIYNDDFKMNVITEKESELIGRYLPDIVKLIMEQPMTEGEQD